MSSSLFGDYSHNAVRAAAILTNSYVAGTVIEASYSMDQIIIYWSFTKGSLTSGELKVEFSNDNVTFYQQTVTTPAGGVITEDLGEHKVTADGNYRLAIPIKDRFIKVSVKGTGTVTSSSATVDVILGQV